MILKGYLFSALYALACLIFAFVLYKLGVSKKITRKVVHILVGFEWVILYHYMYPTAHFLVVCVFFFLLLLFTYRKKLMPMIASDGENAPGTVYYGLAMSIMGSILLFEPRMVLPFGVGVFCTSFGDGFAGLVGQSISANWNKKVYKNKTLVGASVDLLVCFGITSLFRQYFEINLSIWQCVVIALFALELEIFTGYGLDNITITLGSSLLTYSFVYFDNTNNYIVPILLTPLIIAFAGSKNALTVSGIIAAVVVDIIISISLGNLGFTVLLAFFIGGIIVDKIKKTAQKRRQNDEEIEKRGDCRDHVQVLVNSAIASICAILFAITNERNFVIAFLASLAEALADTTASGIGVIRGKAFDVFRMKSVPAGLSGGMSLLGTFASLLGATLISVIAYSFGSITLIEASIVTLAAFLGGIFDSFLGSILQVKYRCSICGIITEKENHCGAKTNKHSGISFINNDFVNLLGTLFASVVAALLYSLM